MYHNPFFKLAQPLSATDLSDVEQVIGYVLPPSLRQHYLQYNGGVPERRYFVSHAGMECEVSHFLSMTFPRSDGDVTFEKSIQLLVLEKHLIPETLVPFAVDSGDDFYCIDRRDESVVYYSMDHTDEPERAASRIADSLREFIDGMITEEEAFG